ncbi:MAG: RES family NAD+ phosphorylase [Gammaproteobacteria bacterium]|nr:RES family NAD+ phosphorylase [Gammaproteobacteria bacterium]
MDGEPRPAEGGLPPVSLVRRHDTHRLIPSKYSDDGASVLARIADDDSHLAQIFDLDHATNDRLMAENDRLPGIGVHELVFGVPYYRIVNAAFTHAHPLGGRFNSPERGAWYTAFESKTAQAEVAFHKTVHLAEIGRFEDEVTFDDYLSDFSGGFHDLRRQSAFRDCLDPDSYVRSQALAERLQAAGSLGVVYPSARRPEGTCLACFRPALVGNVRKGSTYRFRWSGSPTPAIALVRGRK